MSTPDAQEWGGLATVEVDALLAQDPVVVLPLAALEQHGPHLPLSTDLEIGLGIVRAAFRALPDGFPASRLPAQTFGASAEHRSFPGTLSLDPETMTSIICGVGRSLAGAGVRRLVLSNSHGGNRAAMSTAGLRLREEEGLLVINASYFDFDPPQGVKIPDAEWRHGLHGGAVETAMMLHLRPGLVRSRRRVRAPSLGEDLEAAGSRIAPTGPASFSWLAEDLNASGAVGDATLGNAEDGKRLVEHYGGILADVIRDAKTFPMERLG